MKLWHDIDLDDLGVDLLFEANYRREEPRICLQMITWRHEKYIVKAVSSILEQTYVNYQLVISDDASPDNTKQILLDYLKSYTGLAQIFYFRQWKNGGIKGKGHVRLFKAMRRGEIVMTMDGDDFSISDRIEKTVQIWDSLEPKPSQMIVNAYRFIDANGEVDGLAHNDFGDLKTRKFFPPRNPIDAAFPVFGAGTVRSREFADWCEQFAQIGKIIAGDVVYARRALLHKGIWIVNEPLFYYRVNEASVSGKGIAGKIWWHDRYIRWLQLESDYETIYGKNKVPIHIKRQLVYWIKRSNFSDRLIDMKLWKWLLLWPCFLFYSPGGAIGALKCRLRLLLCGNTNIGLKTYISSIVSKLINRFKRKVPL